MNPIFVSVLLITGASLGQSPAEPPPSFLYEPAYHIDDVLRGQPRPYDLQPGDIMLYTDKNFFWEVTHDCAFAFQPHGSGIVVRRPDGSLGILEAGPNDTLWVSILDAIPHLKEYESRGPVWIRQRKCPLTPEQSACLTDWAMRQEGKHFAIVRLCGQVTPLRTRGPLKTFFFGQPKGEHDSYFCSELVTETMVHVGLVDRETARPCCTYPHDLFYDWSWNLYLNMHFTLAHGWYPPARWVSYEHPIK
jgi:hypothetical protein